MLRCAVVRCNTVYFANIGLCSVLLLGSLLRRNIIVRCMTKHLCPAELDTVQQMAAAGKTPMQIHSRLAGRRARKGESCPTINNIRRAMKGKTHCRGRKECRGRKKTISAKKLQCIDRVRLKLLKQAKGLKEVTLKEIKQVARFTGSESTLSRALKTLGVSWRCPRARVRRPGLSVFAASQKTWADKGYGTPSKPLTEKSLRTTTRAIAALFMARWRESCTLPVLTLSSESHTCTLPARLARDTGGKPWKASSDWSFE